MLVEKYQLKVCVRGCAWAWISSGSRGIATISSPGARSRQQASDGAPDVFGGFQIGFERGPASASDPRDGDLRNATPFAPSRLTCALLTNLPSLPRQVSNTKDPEGDLQAMLANA